MSSITLPENKLRELIKKCLNDLLISELKNDKKSYDDIVDFNLYDCGYINEMAFHKKDFIYYISNIRLQLIQNWCLCAYCSIYDKNNSNFNHWIGEFSAYANRIKNSVLKSGNKKNIIYDIYINRFDLNSNEMIKRIINGNFIKEKILDTKIIDSISNICADNAESLVKFLGDDKYTTEEYIMRTFK